MSMPTFNRYCRCLAGTHRRARSADAIEMFVCIETERRSREGHRCSRPRPFIKEQSVYTIAIHKRSFIYSFNYSFIYSVSMESSFR